MDSLLQHQITATIATFGIATAMAVASVAPPAHSPIGSVPVALAAQSEPLSPALATFSPPGLIGQQVAFHVAFLADFLSTGAQLFARELPIPLTLAADIGTGTPVSTAVVRALGQFAAVEVEAGNDLLRFGAEYVRFQTQFVAGLIPHQSASAPTTTLAPLRVVGSAHLAPTQATTVVPRHRSAGGAALRLLTTQPVNPLGRGADESAGAATTGLSRSGDVHRIGTDHSGSSTPGNPGQSADQHERRHGGHHD